MYLTVLGVNRTVAVATNPAGAGIVTGSGTFPEGTSATLTATPDANHVFSGWSGDLTGSNNPLTFTVGPQNYSITANFALRTYTVAASVAPVGAGTVSGTGTYNVGTTATLTAVPDATHNFTAWTGDVSGSANPLTVVVNGNVSVVANFAATSFALTTAATAGGSVTPGGTYLPRRPRNEAEVLRQMQQRHAARQRDLDNRRHRLGGAGRKLATI